MSLMGYTHNEVEAMANAVAVVIDTLQLSQGEEKLDANLRSTLDFLQGLLEEERV